MMSQWHPQYTAPGISQLAGHANVQALHLKSQPPDLVKKAADLSAAPGYDSTFEFFKFILVKFGTLSRTFKLDNNQMTEKCMFESSHCHTLYITNDLMDNLSAISTFKQIYARKLYLLPSVIKSLKFAILFYEQNHRSSNQRAQNWLSYFPSVSTKICLALN